MNHINQSDLADAKVNVASSNKVSLETELSETLYNTMKDFVLSNPTWDQYKLINSALATFLVQNGCTDNSVSEISFSSSNFFLLFSSLFWTMSKSESIISVLIVSRSLAGFIFEFT